MNTQHTIIKFFPFQWAYEQIIFHVEKKQAVKLKLYIDSKVNKTEYFFGRYKKKQWNTSWGYVRIYCQIDRADNNCSEIKRQGVKRECENFKMFS